MSQANPPEVAKYQKFLIFAIIANLGLNIVSRLIPDSLLIVIPFIVIALAMMVAFLVLVYRLTTAMGWEILPKILCLVAMFIPLIGLITLVVINMKAIKILRAAGYPVGFFGVKGAAG